MSLFLNDKERNIFEIKLKKENLYLISEFEFTVYEEKNIFQLSSSEEFLEEIIQKVNKKNITNMEILFQEFSNLYDILMNGEKENTPLYEGQDVFELENDNHDIKFVDRIRIKNEEFNNDLFLVIFHYIEPKALIQLNRVSKIWKTLVENDVLWETICKRNLIKKNQESWREAYIKAMKYSSFTFCKFSGSGSNYQQLNSNLIEKNENQDLNTVAVGSKIWSSGLVKFKFLLESNVAKNQNWFSYGITGSEDLDANLLFHRTSVNFTYSGDNKGYCGTFLESKFTKEGQTDVKEGDVFIVTIDFNKLELLSYNERTKVTRKIQNIQNIPYRAVFNLNGSNQKIRIL